VQITSSTTVRKELKLNSADLQNQTRERELGCGRSMGRDAELRMDLYHGARLPPSLSRGLLPAKREETMGEAGIWIYGREMELREAQTNASTGTACPCLPPNFFNKMKKGKLHEIKLKYCIKLRFRLSIPLTNPFFYSSSSLFDPGLKN
jgi:hypothetical protein